MMSRPDQAEADLMRALALLNPPPVVDAPTAAPPYCNIDRSGRSLRGPVARNLPYPILRLVATSSPASPLDRSTLPFQDVA